MTASTQILADKPTHVAMPEVEQDPALYIVNLFRLAAQRLGVEEVTNIAESLAKPQYSLSYVTLQQEGIRDRSEFLFESNCPYFKTLMSGLVAHEKANVTTPDVCYAPKQDVQFNFINHQLEKQYQRRIYRIVDALTDPDEQLESSLNNMREILAKVPYSPQSEQDDVANFEIAGKKFHLSIEPLQNYRDGVLVIGVNIYASQLLHEVIKAELLDSRAAFKARPTGLVADGQTSLRVLNELLSDSDKFTARLSRIEAKQASARNFERE